MSEPTTTTARAGRRAWGGLAVLALTSLLLSLDVSVLYLALPHLSADLGADGTQQLWILDIYSFLLAGFLVTMGSLGDRIGRRRLLLIGAAVFGVCSVVAAYATTPAMLIAARAALGVAGATLMPSSMALIRAMFPDPKQMGTAIGAWYACFMGGMALGPLVGGALLQHFWWGSAFLLGVPFMVLLLVAGRALLPESRIPSGGRLDVASVVLSLAAILPVVHGLKGLSRGGDPVTSVVTVLVGVALAVVFVRRQRRLADPLLDLSLFANRTAGTALAVSVLGGVVMAGISLVTSQYLQIVAGLTPLHAGLWLIPQNLGLLAGALLGPALARRISTVRVVVTGLVVCGIGLLLQARVGAVDGLPLLATGMVLASFGVMLACTLVVTVLFGATPPEKAGAAASVSETSGEFGVAMGIATLGTLSGWIYRAQLADGLTSDAAYTAGLNVVGGVGAAILLALAVVTALAMRSSGPPAQPVAADDASVSEAPPVPAGR
ncbi:MAG: MFS transporter [Streptosporangiales bacterium]|nr:MFS transporter [Streptosporangiales bacterium]